MPETVSAEVVEFCERAGALDDLRAAVSLAHEYFPDAQGLNAELVRDPDSDDAWVSVTITVAGDVAAIAARDDAYTDRWIARTPWPRTYRIRHAIDIV
jgi:hypothetical protein